MAPETSIQGRLPRDRPLMIVANRVNSLIDPALLIGFLPVRPRFLAKSTLWQMASLHPFLRFAAAIPVYRRHDAGADTSKNADTFAACHEVLRAKGVIALFPEGTSHNEPALIPLKTGVSRIVLEAEHKYGGIGSRIVPVAAAYPPGRVALFVVKSLALMAWRAPLALVGTVLCYPAWRGVRAIARKKATSPDLLSTYKLFPALVAYPATWILAIMAAGFFAGWWAALTAAFAAPVSAVVALRYHERREHFARQARAYLLLKSGRPRIEELRRLRREVLASVEALAEAWRRSRASTNQENSSHKGTPP